VTISVEPPKLTAENEKKLADAYRAAQDAEPDVNAWLLAPPCGKIAAGACISHQQKPFLLSGQA
jgi:hypothetical protein